MNQEEMCRGAGDEVELREYPSSLVTCPRCGRKNLGAVHVSVDGTGQVPMHRPSKRDVMAEAQRALAANARSMATDDSRFAPWNAGALWTE